MTFLKFRVCGFSSPSGKLAKIACQVKHTPLICTKYILLYLMGILIDQYCKNKRWNTCEKSMKRAVYPHKSKDQEKNRLYRIGSSRCALHRRLELAYSLPCALHGIFGHWLIFHTLNWLIRVDCLLAGTCQQYTFHIIYCLSRRAEKEV